MLPPFTVAVAVTLTDADSMRWKQRCRVGPMEARRSAMAGFEQQVKDRAHELKVLLKKGVKIVGEYSKKGWNKVKNIKR
ncbi:hypothetical protein SAY86_013437 [Trapa natans]|uniref:Uncharacterized protein n=1 Tax=Trapa natans TaxID=22666 RepID=A0AAN7MEG0_TRANT|nr:hypothetical protein SAY86_013437 [Trapa natans]